MENADGSKFTPTGLASAAGISVPYASQILSGTRAPSRALALRIWGATGLKAGPIEALSDSDVATLARIEGAPTDQQESPRVAMCGACDLHAASPEIRACTRTDCPMTGRVAQELAA